MSGWGILRSFNGVTNTFPTCSESLKKLWHSPKTTFIPPTSPQSLAVAEPLDGPLMGRYQDLAARTGLWLSLGGFQESGPDPDHVYNAHVIVSDKGKIAAVYRKIHLFDVDIPDGPTLLESRFTAPGACMACCEAPAGRLGLSTCYDLRFPELYQRLVYDHGATILLMPSCFTVPTGVLD